MLKYVPGHFRTLTFWLAIGLASSMYLATGRIGPVLGSVMLVLGLFLADQTTHLAQMDHSAPPPAFIEKLMQVFRWTFLIGGFGIAIFGALAMVLL